MQLKSCELSIVARASRLWNVRNLNLAWVIAETVHATPFPVFLDPFAPRPVKLASEAS